MSERIPSLRHDARHPLGPPPPAPPRCRGKGLQGRRHSKTLAPSARGSNSRPSRRSLVRPDFARLGTTREPPHSLRERFQTDAARGAPKSALPRHRAGARSGGLCRGLAIGERIRAVAWRRASRPRRLGAPRCPIVRSRRVRSAAVRASPLGVRSQAGPRGDAMSDSANRARMERAASSGGSRRRGRDARRRAGGAIRRASGATGRRDRRAIECQAKVAANEMRKTYVSSKSTSPGGRRHGFSA